jgi:branched-chain amino acid transport system ATP-binding protein
VNGLALREARAGYASVEVLHGVDLAVPAGAVTALIGPNGAGKTSALRVLAGVLPLRSGTLTWDGEPISKLSAYERARRGLMLVPDERAVFPSLTVRENLQVVAEAYQRTDLSPALDTFPRLAERLDQRAGSMSGGERRMLALSRALLAEPSVLLVDELSLGLAPRVAAQLFATVRELAAAGITVVLADQFADAVLQMADVAYVLNRGELSFAGDPAEITAAPAA